MSNEKRPVNSHKAYHAHVYFDQKTLAFAERLCKKSGDKFGLKVGRVHQKLVGPHPAWSCQILFGAKDFEAFVPWLDEHRNDLSVLIHALSGNDLDDHTLYAYWLGESAALDVSMFVR